MKLKSLLLILLGILSFAVSSLVHAQAPRAGSEYSVYSPPQPTDVAQGKIEVTEFFAYTCSHCHDMDPLLNSWIKNQSKEVVLRRVPVVFHAQFVNPAKVYYAFESMGVLDKLHPEFFNAIHRDRLKYNDEKALFDWVASKGVDAAKFAEVYKSFAVQSKVQRADQLTRAYGIQGTPTLVINGKYQISNQLEHGAQLKVADYLIAKAKSEKN